MKKALYTRRELLLLILLAGIQFCHIVDFMIIMPLGPQLMQSLNASAAQFGFLVAVYNLAAGICGFFASLYADRFDRKRLIIFLYCGFTLGTWGCSTTDHYYSLLVMRAATGMFGGVLTSIIFAVVGDLFEDKRRGGAMGILMTGFSAASVLGVPLGVWLGAKFTWQFPFMCIASLSALGIIAVAKILPPLRSHLESKGGHAEHKFRFYNRIFSTPSTRSALLFMAVLTFGNFIIIPYISPAMVANVGFTDHDLSLMYLMGGVVSFIAGPMVGRLADHFGKIRIFRIFAVFSFVPFLLITHLGNISHVIAFGVSSLFFLSMSGRMVPTTALVSTTILARERGRFMSLVNCVQQLTSSAAASFAGSVVSYNAAGYLQHYNILGYISCLSTILGIFLITRIISIG